jgi:hypothetical protein
MDAAAIATTMVQAWSFTGLWQRYQLKRVCLSIIF